MRIVPFLLLMLLAVTALAQELTVAEVIAAQRAGAPEEGILRLIAEAATVAPLAPADVARLRQAGVPERVIQAFAARSTPTPTPAPARPDDPRLTEIVRMLSAGVSVEVVAVQVRQSGQHYTPTVNDLIYLKQNRVADEVILALVASGSVTSAVPSPVPTTQPTAFGPLLRLSGVFRRESTGTLVLGTDRWDWSDARGSGSNESLPVASLRAVWLGSVPLGSSRQVPELRVRTVSGDEVTFRDADWASGGGEQVARLYRVIEERFPTVISREKRQP